MKYLITLLTTIISGFIPFFFEWVAGREWPQIFHRSPYLAWDLGCALFFAFVWGGGIFAILIAWSNMNDEN